MTDQIPLAERTIGNYLSTLGSSAPAPGGGSVAGLVGALGAGLGQMVISLTVKASPNAELESSFARLNEAITSLLDSAAADELAYGGYVTATRLPKTTDEEKATRKAAMQAALINAAEVPLGLAESASDVLRLLEPIVLDGTSHALSDAEIAISLAEASVLAGLVNVRINIPLIKDETQATAMAAAANTIESGARHQAATLRQLLVQRRSA